jgi:pimeloyl-ACP methyl ester carboxylesterase
MARDAIAFLAAMEFGQADVLGFSIGSFVAQDITLIRPGVLRRLILASSAPQGAAGMHGWATDVIDAVGVPEVDPERVLDVFNTRSPSSRHAGEQAFHRMYARTPDRDQPTTRTTRQARYDAVCAWGIPLQDLHHYYGPSRPCAPPRYSAAHGARRLRSSLSQPGQVHPRPSAAAIGATGSPVPCQRP